MQEPRTAGTLLRETRHALGYTFKDVTMRTGIDGALLSRWETGKVTDMQVYQLFKLVEVLGLDMTVVARLLAADEEARRAKSGAGGASGRGGGRSAASDEVAVAGDARRPDPRPTPRRRRSSPPPAS